LSVSVETLAALGAGLRLRQEGLDGDPRVRALLSRCWFSGSIGDEFKGARLWSVSILTVVWPFGTLWARIEPAVAWRGFIGARRSTLFASQLSLSSEVKRRQPR